MQEIIVVDPNLRKEIYPNNATFNHIGQLPVDAHLIAVCFVACQLVMQLEKKAVFHDFLHPLVILQECLHTYKKIKNYLTIFEGNHTSKSKP